MQYRCPRCGGPLTRTALDTLLFCTRCSVGYPVSDLEGYHVCGVDVAEEPVRRTKRPMGVGIPVAVAVLSLAAMLVTQISTLDAGGRAALGPRPTRTPGLRPSTTQTHFAPRHGLGTLAVDNGTMDDGFVRLASSLDSPVIAAGSVRAGETMRLEGIPDGDYQVWYCTGSDWRPATYDFSDRYRCQYFEDRFAFSTTLSPHGWTYRTWEVTLHKVPSGNANTRYADPDNLPPLH